MPNKVTNKNNIASNSKTVRTKKKPLEFIDFIDDSSFSDLIPFSNRFHLSAARSDLRKVQQSRDTFDVIVGETASHDNNRAKHDSLDDRLLFLTDPKILVQFKQNKDGKRRIVISENNYDETTLWRIHDAYRVDGAVSRSLDTMVEAIVGRKRTSLILDTNDYFDNDEDEVAKLDEIKNNDLYRKYVRDISKINKHLNMNNYEKMILSSALIYGRAALLIEYDKDALVDNTALPIALKPLSSLRMGRTFYYEDTWELAGIEYLDFREDQRIVEPYRLVYFVNKDYHISPRTLHNGYSILEPILDISETNTLNKQTNIKEINKRLWAAFLIIKYHGKSGKDITNFKKHYKPGMPIISNRDFEAEVHEVAHDLEKLIAQGLDSDKKISRDIKIPIMLTGHDNEQTMATAGTVIHSWINFTLETQRTTFRNIFEKQWIEPLMLRLINKNDELDKFLAEIEFSDDSGSGSDDVSLDDNNNDSNEESNGSTSNKQGFIVSDKEARILDPIDLPFKIKLKFTPFTIDTFLDKVASVLGLVRDGIITKLMALEELDRKQYIPEMKLIHEEQQALFEDMMQQEQQQQEGQQPNNTSKKSDIPGFPKVDEKLKNATDLNKRKSKNSSSGSNKTMRSL
ncbi:MAG: hypothetical protein L0H53_00600 [Candidatus Nitrosocosmicus sp.]|nr:hypothetical protein [Candidatus Nitrosocosmicus sp.]MDN5866036.1 hypothetical protein [Candidatus Nitrosocosmicus sp.]